MKVKKSANYKARQELDAPALNEEAGLAHEVGAFEAKTHLSAILAKVASGHTYYITKRGERIAELRPVLNAPKTRKLGLWKGWIEVAPDFDAPLDDFKEYM